MSSSYDTFGLSSELTHIILLFNHGLVLGTNDAIYLIFIFFLERIIIVKKGNFLFGNVCDFKRKSLENKRKIDVRMSTRA